MRVLRLAWIDTVTTVGFIMFHGDELTGMHNNYLNQNNMTAIRKGNRHANCFLLIATNCLAAHFRAETTERSNTTIYRFLILKHWPSLSPCLDQLPQQQLRYWFAIG